MYRSKFNRIQQQFGNFKIFKYVKGGINLNLQNQYLIKFDSLQSVDSISRFLNDSLGFEFHGPCSETKLLTVTNDEVLKINGNIKDIINDVNNGLKNNYKYGYQHQLYEIGVPMAWELSTGSRTSVAVVSEGGTSTQPTNYPENNFDYTNFRSINGNINQGTNSFYKYPMNDTYMNETSTQTIDFGTQMLFNTNDNKYYKCNSGHCVPSFSIIASAGNNSTMDLKNGVVGISYNSLIIHGINETNFNNTDTTFNSLNFYDFDGENDNGIYSPAVFNLSFNNASLTTGNVYQSGNPRKKIDGDNECILYPYYASYFISGIPLVSALGNWIYEDINNPGQMKLQVVSRNKDNIYNYCRLSTKNAFSIRYPACVLITLSEFPAIIRNRYYQMINDVNNKYFHDIEAFDIKVLCVGTIDLVKDEYGLIKSSNFPDGFMFSGGLEKFSIDPNPHIRKEKKAKLQWI